MKNPTGYASTYFHEVGHCMDDYSDSIMGISGNSTYDFYDVLKSDYEAFLNKVQEENGLTRDEAYIWVKGWLEEDEDIKSAVADILFGLSDGKIKARWGHTMNEYSKSMIEKLNGNANSIYIDFLKEDLYIRYIKSSKEIDEKFAINDVETLKEYINSIKAHTDNYNRDDRSSEMQIFLWSIYFETEENTYSFTGFDDYPDY